MKCPNCQNPNTVVKDSRNLARTRRRRRECPQCNHRFTTTEVVGIHKADSLPLLQPDLLMRDGNTKEFNKEKLEEDIKRSCSRLKITSEDIKQIVESVCELVHKNEVDPVDVKDLIAWTVAALSEVDSIAASRYAAQHLDFESPEALQDHIKGLCG